MTELILTTPEALQELLYSALSRFQAQEKVGAPSDWMTTTEAAEYLRYSKSRLLQLCSSKSIPYHKVMGSNRFSRRELDQWVVDG